MTRPSCRLTRGDGHVGTLGMRVPRLLEHLSASSLAAVICSLSACGTLENGSAWGADATLQPGWHRASQAAIHAVLDLQTLIPAAGAIIFAIGDLDEELSDWATTEIPIFRSQRAARKFSDWANVALGAESLITLVATPSGESFDKDWIVSKSKGFAVEGAAALATFGVSEALKSSITRRRPDDSDDDSFLSGHTSAAFTFSTLANRNLNSVKMPGYLRRLTQIGTLGTATAVGWARVEGEKHFPSDVLAGAAVGYFVNAFIHDAFLVLPEDARFGFTVFPMTEGGAMASIFFNF